MTDTRRGQRLGQGGNLEPADSDRFDTKILSSSSAIILCLHMGEFVVEGFFFLEVVTFFVTLRADLEDYFKCKT